MTAIAYQAAMNMIDREQPPARAMIRVCRTKGRTVPGWLDKLDGKSGPVMDACEYPFDPAVLETHAYAFWLVGMPTPEPIAGLDLLLLPRIEEMGEPAPLPRHDAG